MRLKTFALAATTALTMATGGAFAANLTASDWLPRSYAESEFGYEEMSARIAEKTGGAFTIETHYGGSLLPARTTLQGIRDGVVDLGLIYPPYTPAELPIGEFLNNLSFLSTDSLAAALAYTELNYTNETVKAEWAKFDIIFGGAYATPGYQFMCNTEVKNLAEAEGKRMRTAGGSFTALANSLGGTAVSVPIGDAYSGMQRGSLDCILADPTNLLSASFNEVVKHITMANLGLVPGATWAYNQDSWRGLSEEDRVMLLNEMAFALVRQQAGFAAQEKESLDDARSRGIPVVEPDADLATHVTDMKSSFIGDVIAGIDPNVIPDAQGIADEYAALQQQWVDLLADVDRTDDDAVFAVVKENLLSKIDLATFGM